jgi:hypothetical protein
MLKFWSLKLITKISKEAYLLGEKGKDIPVSGYGGP